VSLPDTVIGGQAVEFLGALIFSRIYRAARDLHYLKKKPLFLHVDEFQRFVTTEIEELVAEARKFSVCLCFAHQNLRQLDAFSVYEGATNTRLSEAIFANVGTMVVMKTSGRDASVFANELDLHERHIHDIGQYEALARCCVNGEEQRAFTVRPPLAEALDAPNSKTASKRLRDKMIREHYWYRREEVLPDLETQLAELREKRRISMDDVIPKDATRQSERSRSEARRKYDFVAATKTSRKSLQQDNNNK
jgi:hypothetical protein